MRQRASAPAAATISSDYLNTVKAVAQQPLRNALMGSPPVPRPPRFDAEVAEERKERMRALDMQRLQEKVAAGAADEEQVVAIAKTLGASSRRAAPAPSPPLFLPHTPRRAFSYAPPFLSRSAPRDYHRGGHQNACTGAAWQGGAGAQCAAADEGGARGAVAW